MSFIVSSDRGNNSNVTRRSVAFDGEREKYGDIVAVSENHSTLSSPLQKIKIRSGEEFKHEKEKETVTKDNNNTGCSVIETDRTNQREGISIRKSSIAGLFNTSSSLDQVALQSLGPLLSKRSSEPNIPFAIPLYGKFNSESPIVKSQHNKQLSNESLISPELVACDSDVAECCDLGLGFGLKPGGLPPVSDDLTDNLSSPFKPNNASVSCAESVLNDKNCCTISSPTQLVDHYYLCQRHTPKKKWFRRSKSLNIGDSNHFKQRSKSKSSVSSAEDQDGSDIGVRCPTFPDTASKNSDDEAFEDPETFPAFADVPMGTSIRQQKILFHHDANEILNRSPLGLNASREILNKVSRFDPIICWKCYEEQDIEDRLRRAEQEVRILRHELDRSQKQLDTKYKAIQILQRQSQVAQCEYDVSSRKVYNMTKAMEQEINKLQFELEYRQSSLMDSQQTWAGRFDRVCQENAALMASLEERTEQLRRMHSDKMAVCRERDELLALLDVKERLKYEQTRVQGQPEDAYDQFTSNELAVLGACNCRGTCGEPCGCAYAAANLRREIIKLKDINQTQNRRREEANTTADAYRMAFEEQLYRNKALTSKLAEMTCPFMAPTNRKHSPLSVMKWLVKQLNDDVPPSRRRHIAPSTALLRTNEPEPATASSNASTTSTTVPCTSAASTTFCTTAPTADSTTTSTIDSTTDCASASTPIANTSTTPPATSINATDSTTATSATSTTTTANDESSPAQDVQPTETATPAPSTAANTTNAYCDEPPKFHVAEEITWSSDDITNIKNEQQLIAYLLEKLNEQNEALAHQRLAARMLATRTAELETRLSLHGDDLTDVNHTRVPDP